MVTPVLATQNASKLIVIIIMNGPEIKIRGLQGQCVQVLEGPNTAVADLDGAKPVPPLGDGLTPSLTVLLICDDGTVLWQEHHQFISSNTSYKDVYSILHTLTS